MLALIIALLAQLNFAQPFACAPIPNGMTCLNLTPTPTATLVPTPIPTVAPTPPPTAAPTATPWEPRPSNASYNAVEPTAAQLAAFWSGNPVREVGVQGWFKQVNGQKTGTTPQILAWAAAKWNLNLTLVEAVADVESGWQQNAHGDTTEVTPACPNCGSWGILQIKETPNEGWPQTYPASHLSTAFNVDFWAAYVSACENHSIGYLAQRTPLAGHGAYATDTGQDLLLGCVGQWESGGWWDAGAESYVAKVQAAMAKQPWNGNGF